MTLVLAAAILAAASFIAPRQSDVILYNHTPSIPVGAYIRINAPVRRGAFVTVRAADVAPQAAAARAFNGRRDRFIKRVAAVAGDHICALGSEFVVNHNVVIARRVHDSRGSFIPLWTGCRTLGPDELLLLGDTPDSFDGRYWGPVRAAQIEGVWRRL